MYKASEETRNKIRKARTKDHTGNRYGKMVAIKLIGYSGRRAIWLCRCDCGNEKLVSADNLIQGHTKSCGCWKKEIIIQRNKDNTKHGLSALPEYNILRGIIGRCNNSNYKNFKDYGGRGIKVFQGWLDPEYGTLAFLQCVGPRPSPLYSIDRIDVNGNYEPGNVRWATDKEQANNKRRKRIEEFTDADIKKEFYRRWPNGI
jgi:hypothetical protein